MTKFLPPYEKQEYLEQALFLYLRYSKFLDDDYAQRGMPVFEYFNQLITSLSPFFWVITEDDEVSGFVYLDNLIGDGERLHSAELTTCFKKKFWGDYTKRCARLFLNFCFERFGFYKIKALVYPENSRVITLLNDSGFRKEALLKYESLRNYSLQDIEVYSVFNTRKAEK